MLYMVHGILHLLGYDDLIKVGSLCGEWSGHEVLSLMVENGRKGRMDGPRTKKENLSFRAQSV
jgi:hypothetical protein